MSHQGCGVPGDLNNLDFAQWAVAFARWWVDCMNPGVEVLDDAVVAGLVELLGHPVTVVYRHL